MTSSDSLTQIIRQQLGDFTSAERKVARALLGAEPTVGLETSTQLSKVAEVSGATVIRFVNRLGFDRYADFQRAIHDELRDRVVAPVDLYPPEPKRTNSDDELELAVEQHLRTIRSSFGSLHASDVNRAVSLLTNLNARVVILGGWFSHSLATHFANLLSEVRGNVCAVDRSPQAKTTTLADMNNHTVCVLFDFRRFEADLEYFGRTAASQGSPIILLTDQWLSPLLEVADVTLMSFVGDPEPFESHVATMSIIELLIQRVIKADLTSARNRSIAVAELAAGSGVDSRAQSSTNLGPFNSKET